MATRPPPATPGSGAAARRSRHRAARSRHRWSCSRPALTCPRAKHVTGRGYGSRWVLRGRSWASLSASMGRFVSQYGQNTQFLDQIQSLNKIDWRRGRARVRTVAFGRRGNVGANVATVGTGERSFLRKPSAAHQHRFGPPGFEAPQRSRAEVRVVEATNASWRPAYCIKLAWRTSEQETVRCDRRDACQDDSRLRRGIAVVAELDDNPIA